MKKRTTKKVVKVKTPTKKSSTEHLCPHCGMREGSEYFRDGRCICGYIVGLG